MSSSLVAAVTTSNMHSTLGGGAEVQWKVLEREFEAAPVFVFNLDAEEFRTQPNMIDKCKVL